MAIDIYKHNLTRDRIRGCLLGVAIGDALGAPFEHMPAGRQKCIQLEPSGGLIRDFHHGQDFPAGAWTDDTGMTLATCRAFVDVLKSNKTIDECISSAYEAWAGSNESRKAGKTVLSAAKYGIPWIDSWTNGALMRISPVAIYAYLLKMNKRDAAALAYRISRVTHGHPLAVFPAIEFVLALLSILSEEETVPVDVSDPGRYCDYLEPVKNARYFLYREKRVLPIDEIHPSTGLWMWRHVFERRLGFSEGITWNSMPEFEAGILSVINGSGDKDTAGAVAGAILGTYWGESRIPTKWRSRVEKAAAILDLADEMMLLAEKIENSP